VPLAVNRGKPVVLSDPGADFSRGITTLADELAAKDERGDDRKRRGLFKRAKAAA